MYKKHQKYRKICIIFGMILIASGALFIGWPGHIHKVDSFVVEKRAALIQLLNAKGVVTIDDVNSLRAWMTFDYINHLFGVPSEYLLKRLALNDPRYPFITLTQYAKSHSIIRSELLTQVQAAVRLYLTQK